MKKVKFNGKLSLNKEAIAKLNNEQMNVVKGGQELTYVTCNRYATIGGPCEYTVQVTACFNCLA